MAEYMTGMELRQGEDIMFRGGVWETGDSYWLYNEDGTLDNFGFSYVTSDGIERDENGDVIDSVEPSAATILELMNAPELTHKGEWFAWFGAVFICVLNTISVGVWHFGSAMSTMQSRLIGKLQEDISAGLF